MIEIDGSTGESGGQILRTALSLACITGKPFSITNIRSKRPKPGLQPQHLTCVNALAKISNAEVRGDAIGSQTLEFWPGEIESGEYSFDIGTAGSITLLAQCLLPVLAKGDTKSKAVFRGGTHVQYSPVAEYFSEVFLQTLFQMKLDATFKLINAGWFPVGGGEAVLEVAPCEFSPIQLVNRKEAIPTVSVHSIYSQLPVSVGQRQLDSVLMPNYTNVVKKLEERKAKCPGTCVFIKADYGNCLAGFSSLGEKGKPAETVAKEAAEQFKTFDCIKNACVDPHLADQLLLYAAISGGKSVFTTSELTKHFETNAWTISCFLPVEVKTQRKVERSGTYFEVAVRGK